MQSDSTDNIEESICRLQDSYLNYMRALKEVLDYGEANVAPLTSKLTHKHANPLVKALGLMMYGETANGAIPRLLDWLMIQSPMYPDVLEALVRAGDKVLPELLIRLRESASRDDDEAVNNLLDLGRRLRGRAIEDIIAVLMELLQHPNSDIRETALDAVRIIGLPSAAATRVLVDRIAIADPVEVVRKSAEDTLLRLGKGMPN